MHDARCTCCSVDEVYAAARAEGLTLIKSRADAGILSQSGFKAVGQKHGVPGRWFARTGGSRRSAHPQRDEWIGPYATAEEAALNL